MIRVGRQVAILGAPLLVAVSLLLPLAGCGAPTGAQSEAQQTPAPEVVTLVTADASFGTYLTDSAGRALYMWAKDRNGTSNCYDDCAEAWPPVTFAGHVTAGPDVNEKLIGAVTREDGTKQATYGGWPLYYFAPDVAPGQLTGQGDTGFGAVWWVLSPDGKPLPSA